MRKNFLADAVDWIFENVLEFTSPGYKLRSLPSLEAEIEALDEIEADLMEYKRQLELALRMIELAREARF